MWQDVKKERWVLKLALVRNWWKVLNYVKDALKSWNDKADHRDDDDDEVWGDNDDDDNGEWTTLVLIMMMTTMVMLMMDSPSNVSRQPREWDIVEGKVREVLQMSETLRESAMKCLVLNNLCVSFANDRWLVDDVCLVINSCRSIV